MNFKTITTITRSLKPLMHIIDRERHSQIGQRVILMYHGISKIPRTNCIAQSLFKEQISCLKEKYAVIPLSALIENLRSPSLSGELDLASITFDDGYFNFAELALPILQEINCHATLFVPSGKAGSYNDWDENKNGFHKMEIMTYEALRQLPERYVEIGSHGISHIPLDRLPEKEIKREIIESRLHLEQNIARPIQFFAFPFGVYPFRCKFKIYDDEKNLSGGYRAACTSWWGRHNTLKDRNKLRRIGIWDSDSFSDFVDKLDGYYDWLEVKEGVGRSLKIIKGNMQRRKI